MIVCLDGCVPSGSGMKAIVSFRGNKVLTLFSCLIMAQWGQMGFFFCRSQMQLCPRLTHMPVVSFFCIGNVKNVVVARAVRCLHTWCIFAAAASMPRSSHQQQIVVMSRAASVWRNHTPGSASSVGKGV